MKPDIKICRGGEMPGPSGELITWQASNSIRLSVETTNLEAAENILSDAAEQVAKLVPHLQPLNHYGSDLEPYYVVSVSVAQPRVKEEVVGSSQSRLEAEPLALDLEDDEDEVVEVEEG